MWNGIATQLAPLTMFLMVITTIFRTGRREGGREGLDIGSHSLRVGDIQPGLKNPKQDIDIVVTPEVA